MKRTLVFCGVLLALTGLITYGLTGLSDVRTKEMDRIWEQIDSAKAGTAANAAPANTVSTAPPATKGVEQPDEPQLSEKTDVEPAAYALAGTTVARGLLLKAWQPKRIAKVGRGPDDTDSPRCEDYGSVLVGYDHRRDLLKADQETCWDEGSRGDDNHRFQAAYLAGVTATNLAADADRLAADRAADALRVNVQYCIVGRKFDLPAFTQCEALTEPRIDSSLPASVTHDLLSTVQMQTSRAQACADAVVSANEKNIRALAAQLAPELRESALAAWTHNGNPQPDVFDFTLTTALTTFRKTHKLAMPTARKHKGLPKWCVAAR